jgi:capsular exopolysaccharide synthesis family protein
MGKVYEALKKAEDEGKPTDWLSVAVEDEFDSSSAAQQRGNGTREKSNGRNGRSNGSEKTDFIDYSLNAADAVEIERRNREFAGAEAARKELTRPEREVIIDTASIPPQLISFHNLNADGAEEYNKLAITLITTASERPLKRVLVASAQHGDGRTSITLNLACALARARSRVLVVDTDLHRPSLLRFLGVNTEVGLSDAISQGLSAGSAVVRIQPFGFDLLPTREQVQNPAELLSSSSFEEMLELLEPDYDFILFDSPPLLTVADSSLLMRITEATVLVIRSGKTTSGQVGKAISRLAPEKLLGVVLNRADRAA